MRVGVGGRSIECLDALLLNGTTVNAETLDGTTPLHFAAHFGFADCVRLLLDHVRRPRQEKHSNRILVKVVTV